MKKRVLCFILALVMVLPLVLVSCDSQSEADRMKEIILGTEGDETERAYTLSLWIPTNKITIEGVTADLSELSQKDRKALQKDNPEIYEFLVRVDAVEDALNKILVSRNYYTHIDIVPVNDNFYEKAIDDRFDSMSKVSKPGDMNKRGDSDEYKNDVTEEIVGDSTLYKLLYRPVDKKQLDLFLIRSYDKYVSYIKSNYILALNNLTAIEPTEENPDSPSLPASNYITSTGKYYGIYKFIRQEFLNQMKYGEKDLIYALPNNHLYAETYQYILLNKGLLEKYDGVVDIENAESYDDMLAQLKAFVEFSATQADENGNDYQGLVGSPTDAPYYIFADKENMYGGQLGSDKLNFVYSDPNFVNYVSMYKELELSGLATSELKSNESAAVQIINATSKEIANYKNNYDVIVSKVPVVTSEDLYSSMFAISTFSIDFDRSMKMLYLLQTDSEIRTLIQYGIEDEDYNIQTLLDKNNKEYEIITLRDTAYKNAFEVMYTGNSYYTYPSNNSEIDDWDYVKETNLDVTVGQYFKFDNHIKYFVTLSDQEKEVLDNYDRLKELFDKTNESVSEMSYDEFNNFLAVMKEDVLYLNNSLVDAENNYSSKLQDYETKLQALKDSINTTADGLADEEQKAEFIRLSNEILGYLDEYHELLANDASEEQINEIDEKIKAAQDLRNVISFDTGIAESLFITSLKDFAGIEKILKFTPSKIQALKEKSISAYNFKLSNDYLVINGLYTKVFNDLQPKQK